MAKQPKTEDDQAVMQQQEKCGIVMPISPIDGCDETHWANVRDILADAIREAGYEPNLVSAADEIGVIQKRIVQNLYENPIVVCDVSGKNPNVMLELGMRLAFDKPVIIVKDDKTSYSFDTAPIEHLGYPRDLRFQTIVDFKEILAKKIEHTVAAAKKGGHTTFLGHFGQFKVAKIDTEELTADKYILSQLQDIKDHLQLLGSKQLPSIVRHPVDLHQIRNRSMRHAALEYAESIVLNAAQHKQKLSVREVDYLTSSVSAFVRKHFPEVSTEARMELSSALVRDVLELSSIEVV